MKKSLLLGLGAVAMAFAAGAGISGSRSSHNNLAGVKEALADSSAKTISNNQQSGKTFFIDMSSKTEWVTGANDTFFAIYFYNATVSAWTRVLPVAQAQNYVLAFEIPQYDSKNVSWTTAIAVRLKSSSATFGDADSNVHNKTGNIDISDGTKNAIKITDWWAGSADTIQYGVDSGTSVYVNFNNWTDFDGDNIFMYFFNPIGDDSGSAWSSVAATRVQGTADKVLQAVVPGSGRTFGSMIAVKCKTSEPGWGTGNANVDKQSADLHVASSTASGVHNAMTIYSGNNAWDTNKYSYNLSDSARAIFWGTYFLDQIRCDGEGSISSANWTNVKTDFNNASAPVQTLINNAEGSIEGENDLQTAIYRYDYIVLYKKDLDPVTYASYDDFVSRSTSEHRTDFHSVQKVSLIGTPENNTATLIGALAVSMLAISVGGFFFLRRRKEDR